MSDPYIGEMKWVTYNFAPRGWAFCNGQLLAISQNSALFAVIGISFGGNGTTNFALPEARSRSLAGTGAGPGLTSRSLGQTWGTPTVTLGTTELPAHTHSLRATTQAGVLTEQTSAGNVFCAGLQYSTSAPSANLASSAVVSAGGGQPHNNRQPYLGLNLIIALVGIFPPRL